MTTPNDAQISDSEFDKLLTLGTIAEETVTIYLDQAAGLEAERLIAEYEAAGGASGDQPLSDPYEDLEEKLEEVLDRFNRASIKWTVRAASDEDFEQAYEAIPALVLPARPLDKAGQKALDAWHKKMLTLQEQTKVLDTQRQEWLVAHLTTHLEYGTGATDNSVTPEQVRQIRTRPGGDHWFTVLGDAIDKATKGVREVPRPL